MSNGETNDEDDDRDYLEDDDREHLEDDDRRYLEDIESSAGCAEIWERLTEQREED